MYGTRLRVTGTLSTPVVRVNGSFTAVTKEVTALLWFQEKVDSSFFIIYFLESEGTIAKSSYTESLV